jgi:hypothetical protein
MADAHHTPGEPPPVHDEAGDTPLWVPLLGLSLMAILASSTFLQSPLLPADAATDAAAQEAAVEDEAPAEDADEASAAEAAEEAAE